ncbi:MAG: glycosyltransferase family 2 protein [Candidatus Bathyarchaeia archaeon]
MDFVIATKNSAATIEKCISSIVSSIPKKIVVDNVSSDDTINIVKRLKRKLKDKLEIAQVEGLLGKVRLKQAELASTEWIVYVDSDVYIYKNWWKTTSPYMTQDSGWVLGALRTKYSEPYKSFFEWSIMRFGGVALSNTAVRRRFVLEIADCLEKLHGNEDAPIYEHVLSEGYKAHFVKELIGEHEGDKDGLLPSKAIRAGQSIRIRRALPIALAVGIKLMFTNQAKALLYFIEIKRDVPSLLRLAGIQLWLSLLFLKGIFEIRNIITNLG